MVIREKGSRPFAVLLLMAFTESTTNCPLSCKCDSGVTQLKCSRIDPSNIRVSKATVKYLYVDMITADEISTGMLRNFTSLEKLTITKSQLTVIKKGAFQNTKHLVNISLDNNRIDNIQADTFAQLSHLATLDLSRNLLVDVIRLTPTRGNMLSINVSNNRLEYIGNSMRGIRCRASINTIDASENRIEDVNFSETWYKTENLIIRRNLISNLSSSWANGLGDLKYLDISHNKISYLHRINLKSLRNLLYLDLSYNYLEYLQDGVFVNLHYLEKLILNGNLIMSIDYPAFQSLTHLKQLSMAHMPKLTFLSKQSFKQLTQLYTVNISHNPMLSFLHYSTFSSLIHVNAIDISYNNLTYIVDGTVNNLNATVYLSGNNLKCSCNMMWMLKQKNCYNPNSTSCYIKDFHSVKCRNSLGNLIKISNINEQRVYCEHIRISRSNLSEAVYQLGSTAKLDCDIKYNNREDTKITWMTPRGTVFSYHNYHNYSVIDLPTVHAVNASSAYHKNHIWHKSQVYWNDFGEVPRITVLRNGSLLIDYITKQDAGLYYCSAANSASNATVIVKLLLDYSAMVAAVRMSMLIGFSTALTFFVLTLTIQGIHLLTRYCIKLRKEMAVKKILESLDSYKTLQMVKLRELGAHQMGRFRDQYHHQLDRLRDNYNQHLMRIKENSTMQTDRLRDSYACHMGRLKNYSSTQLYRLRDNYHTQVIKIREYGSQQMDRLRENYRLQQQHLLKIIDTMNIENCRMMTENEGMVPGNYCEPDVIIIHKTKGQEPSSLSSDTLSESDYAIAGSNPDERSYTPDVMSCTPDMMPCTPDVTSYSPDAMSDTDSIRPYSPNISPNTNAEINCPLHNSNKKQALPYDLNEPQALLHNSQEPTLLYNSQEPPRLLYNSQEPPRLLYNSQEPPRLLYNSQEPPRLLYNSPEPPRLLYNSQEPPKLLHTSQEPPALPHNSQEPSALIDNSRKPSALPHNSQKPPKLSHNSYEPPALPRNSYGPLPLPFNYRKNAALKKSSKSTKQNIPHKTSLVTKTSKGGIFYIDDKSPVYIDDKSPVYIDDKSPVYIDDKSPVYIDDKSPEPVSGSSKYGKASGTKRMRHSSHKHHHGARNIPHNTTDIEDLYRVDKEAIDSDILKQRATLETQV